MALQRICAWCGISLSAGAVEADGPVSHGICSGCQDAWLRELADRDGVVIPPREVAAVPAPQNSARAGHSMPAPAGTISGGSHE